MVEVVVISLIWLVCCDSFDSSVIGFSVCYGWVKFFLIRLLGLLVRNSVLIRLCFVILVMWMKVLILVESVVVLGSVFYVVLWWFEVSMLMLRWIGLVMVYFFIIWLVIVMWFGRIC